MAINIGINITIPKNNDKNNELTISSKLIPINPIKIANIQNASIRL